MNNNAKRRAPKRPCNHRWRRANKSYLLACPETYTFTHKSSCTGALAFIRARARALCYGLVQNALKMGAAVYDGNGKHTAMVFGWRHGDAFAIEEEEVRRESKTKFCVHEVLRRLVAPYITIDAGEGCTVARCFDCVMELDSSCGSIRARSWYWGRPRLGDLDALYGYFRSPGSCAQSKPCPSCACANP